MYGVWSDIRNHLLQIFYVGHSMGTTTYMAMNSVDQSWADKVELAVFLAPVAYVGHMRSPVKVSLLFLLLDNTLISAPGSLLGPSPVRGGSHGVE